LVVYRPQLKAPTRPMNVVAQKVDDRHPVIEHTAIVAPRTERPLAGNAAASSPSAKPGSQGQAPGAHPRPTVDRSPAHPQPQPTPKLNRPGSTLPSAKPGAEQPKTAVPAANPGRVEQERPVQGRPAGPAAQQPSGNRQYPLRSGTPNTPDATRPTAPGQSPSAYYPKGYHQSSETRTLPSATARPSTQRSQPTASSRQGTPPENKNTGSSGPSRKNDQ
jgi:hypothetical protein